MKDDQQVLEGARVAEIIDGNITLWELFMLPEEISNEVIKKFAK